MRKKVKFQDKLKSTFSKKAQEINSAFRESQQQQFEQLLHDNLKQLQKIEQLNYKAAILLCSAEKVRNLIISSLFFDALIFIIPADYDFLSPDLRETLLKLCGHIILFFGALIILTPYFTSLISKSKKKLKDPGLITLAAIFLAITSIFILQLLELGEKQNPVPLVIEGIFSLLALGTLYQGLKRVYQSPWRPQINHLLRAVYFFGSLTVIRLAAIIFSLLTALPSNIGFFQWIIFEMTALILIVNIDLPEIYKRSR